MYILIAAKRRLLAAIAVAGFLLLLFLLLLQGGMLPAAATSRQLPIYEVDTPRPEVAVSFDASWGAEYTETILDILDSYDIKTTFFLVNLWLEDYPEMAKEIADRGHEIGLHSATHPDMTTLSSGDMDRELADNCQMIQETTGFNPTLFRPPYGSYNDAVIARVAAAGYTPVQWSVDSLDWQDLSAEAIFQRVTKDIHAGDIVLFHNNGLHTAEAMPMVLDYLESRGLKVVPVSQLLWKYDWYVDVNGVQHSNADQETVDKESTDQESADKETADQEAADK